MTKPTGLVLPPFGAGQISVVQTIKPEDIPNSSGSGNLSANSLIAVLVRVPRHLRTSTVRVFIGTQSGNLDIGQYTSDGTTWTRVASTGSTAVGTGSAVQSVSLTLDWFPGVDYWFALGADNGTAAFARALANSAVNAIGNQVINKSAFPLPATFDTPTSPSTIPWIAAV